MAPRRITFRLWRVIWGSKRGAYSDGILAKERDEVLIFRIAHLASYCSTTDLNGVLRDGVTGCQVNFLNPI